MQKQGCRKVLRIQFVYFSYENEIVKYTRTFYSRGNYKKRTNIHGEVFSVVCHYETGCYCVRKTIVGSVIHVYIGRTMNKETLHSLPLPVCLKSHITSRGKVY